MNITGSLDSALTHLAVVGLATIIDNRLGPITRVGWDLGWDSSPVIDAGALTINDVATILLDHIARHDQPDSWIQAKEPVPKGSQSYMSPRVTGDRANTDWQTSRWSTIDAPTVTNADRRFMGSLGEPSYWNHSKLEVKPYSGASRWEMKTRNRGEEFVGGRLAKLAHATSTATEDEIIKSLLGHRTWDALDTRSDSLTATGLQPDGPADAILTWCALWGISTTPCRPQTDRLELKYRITRHSVDTIIQSENGDNVFYLPVFNHPVPLAVYRSVTRSGPLRDAATHLEAGVRVPEQKTQYLHNKNTAGVMLFHQQTKADGKAPKVWLQHGSFKPL